jgi:hypothetical protein
VSYGKEGKSNAASPAGQIRQGFGVRNTEVSAFATSLLCHDWSNNPETGPGLQMGRLAMGLNIKTGEQKAGEVN